MLNVDFSKARELTAEHLGDLKAQMLAKNGLEYDPREQTAEGRQFEHASDTNSLITHLKTLPARASEQSNLGATKEDFKINLVGDSEESQQDESKTSFISLKRSHFELTLRANGKAEIYFHSYFWSSYLDTVASACGQDIESAF